MQPIGAAQQLDEQAYCSGLAGVAAGSRHDSTQISKFNAQVASMAAEATVKTSGAAAGRQDIIRRVCDCQTPATAGPLGRVDTLLVYQSIWNASEMQSS